MYIKDKQKCSREREREKNIIHVETKSCLYNTTCCKLRASSASMMNSIEFMVIYDEQGEED